MMLAFESLLLTCVCLCIGIEPVIGAEEEIGSPLRVAQCRAHCILKFSKQPKSQEVCFQDPDCLVCWENCQLLQANFAIWGGICSENGICFPGCQEACRFHREISPQQQAVPVIRTRGEEVIFVKNNTAIWSRPSHVRHGKDDPLVYVVMRRLPGCMWRQIIQTLNTTSRVPHDHSSGGLLRVLVVDREGLFTIYSPVAAQSSLRSANDIAGSSGQKNLYKIFNPTGSAQNSLASGEFGHGRRINTEIAKTRFRGMENSTEMAEYTAWNVREISLIHQKVLIIAEIGWDAVPAAYAVSQRPVYFVTWEVAGGGLKGNLFTDSTCVTLSLWPDTVYHIQVELVGHNVASGRPQQSEDFVLDTHRAVAVELETSSHNLTVTNSISEGAATFEGVDTNQVSAEMRDTRAPVGVPRKVDMLAQNEHFEILFAVGAAFAVFLLLLVVLVYASCRHGDVLSYPRASIDIFSLKPSSKQSDFDCSRFPKDFVPILTLVTETVFKSYSRNNDTASASAAVALESHPNFKQTPRPCRNAFGTPKPSFSTSSTIDGLEHQYDDTCSSVGGICAASRPRIYFCDNNTFDGSSGSSIRTSSRNTRIS